MANLISREAAIAQIKENYCDWCDHTDLCKSCETYDCIATIEQHVPTVDAVPVVHAHYVKGSNGEWYCSNCRRIDDKYSVARYCWNCGAKMDGERRENE